MVGGKCLQPSCTLLSFPTDVQAACLLNTLGPGGLSELLDPHVTDEAKSGCLETRPLANQIEKKKPFRVKVQSPSSWLEETRNCKQTLSCPCPFSAARDLVLPLLWHSQPHQPSSPAAWVCLPAKGKLELSCDLEDPGSPAEQIKDILRGNIENH